jgi:hypothetical protein
MFRYYLSSTCQEASISLEGFTIYKDREKNNYIEFLNIKLKKFIDRGLIGYEMISNTGEVMYDSSIVDYQSNLPSEFLEENNDNENITIYNNTTESNSVVDDEPIKKTRKRKVKDAE